MVEGKGSARVLVVEDESLLAAMLAEQLVEIDCEVVGPVGRLSDTADIDLSAIDAVILDLNLHGEMAFDFARSLHGEGVPILVVSAYDAALVRSELPNVDFLAKPFTERNFVTRVRGLLRRAAERRQNA